MHLNPNHAKVFGQRQHGPISKVRIQSDQRSLLLHRSLENQRIVSSRLIDIRSTNNIMPGVA